MMTKIIIVFFGLWAYRRIGVLLYQLNNAYSEYHRKRVNYPNAPNLLAYMFDKYIIRSKFHLIYFDFDQSVWSEGIRKITLEVYKEIYFWPWLRLKKHYWEWRINLYNLLAAKKGKMAR